MHFCLCKKGAAAAAVPACCRPSSTGASAPAPLPRLKCNRARSWSLHPPCPPAPAPRTAPSRRRSAPSTRRPAPERAREHRRGGSQSAINPLLQALAAQRCISAAVSLHGVQPKGQPCTRRLRPRPRSLPEQHSVVLPANHRQCPHLGHIAHGEARVGILDALRPGRGCKTVHFRLAPQPVKPDGQAWDGGGNFVASTARPLRCPKASTARRGKPCMQTPLPSRQQGNSRSPGSVFAPTPSSTTVSSPRGGPVRSRRRR